MSDKSVRHLDFWKVFLPFCTLAFLFDKTFIHPTHGGWALFLMLTGSVFTILFGKYAAWATRSLEKEVDSEYSVDDPEPINKVIGGVVMIITLTVMLLAIFKSNSPFYYESVANMYINATK